ncbi:MAG: PadR family transcriptional regulator [Solirubrobacteraceae bacterium]
MAGPTGSVRAVLLGLVLERPGYGYDLANRLVERLGEIWQIAQKDVYRLLDELTEGGLLEPREERRPGHKRSRVFFHPTALTAPALVLWIETLSPKEPMREGIRAKVVTAREEDARPLLLSLREYERHCLKLARLTQPATNVPAWSGIVLDCARDAVDSQLRSEVEWCRRTRRRIEGHLAQRPD